MLPCTSPITHSGRDGAGGVNATSACLEKILPKRWIYDLIADTPFPSLDHLELLAALDDMADMPAPAYHFHRTMQIVTQAGLSHPRHSSDMTLQSWAMQCGLHGHRTNRTPYEPCPGKPGTATLTVHMKQLQKRP